VGIVRLPRRRTPTIHVVRDNESFLAACHEGLVAATSGRIITFGVKPERAATEYG
jgi:mannose-1-phosphate guanylyltransferase/mannose-6-phosphate isomerase